MDGYEQRKRDTALHAFFGITATWIGAWIPCAVLSEAVGVTFPRELILLLAGFSVPLWFALQAAQSFKYRLLARLTPLVPAAAFCAVFREETMNGIRGILAEFAVRANSYMGWRLPIPFPESTEGMAPFLAWLLPTTILLMFSVSAAGGIAPLAWIAASVFAPTIVVSLNIFPPIWMLVLYVALALYYVVVQDSFALPVRSGNRLRTGAALALAIVTIPATLVINDAFYDENIRYLEVRDRLHDILWEKMPSFFDSKPGSSAQRMGMSNGVLPLDGYVSDAGELRLRVTYPSGMSSIYLRAAAYGEYDGITWNSATRHVFQIEDIDRRGEGVVDISTMTGQIGKDFIDYGPQMTAVRFPIKSSYMSVEVLDEGENYIFTPYDTIAVSGFEGQYVRFSHDREGCFTATEGNRYRYRCNFVYNDWSVPSYLAYTTDITKPSVANTKTPQLAELMARYDEFVHANYLEIPKQCASVNGKVKLSENATVFDAICAVQDYLRGYGYTKRPGPVPKGKDFIMYFLEEKKAGFCVHFASAGVMLFRSLGIPARFAEGYVIQSQDMKDAKPAGTEFMNIRDAGSSRQETISMETLEVYDGSAHAWVEIYIDGYGWFPVEVTFDGESLDDTLAYLSKLRVIDAQPTLTPTPFNTPTPALTGEPTKAPSGAVTPKATATPAPTKTPTPAATKTPTVAPQVTPGITDTPERADDSESGSGPWKTILITGLVLFIIGSALCIRRAYARSRRRSRILGTEPRRAVIAVCREIGYLFRLNGIALQPGETESSYTERVSGVLGNIDALRWIYDLGNRANFGPGTITREERRRALALYRKIRTRTLRGKSFATRFAWVFLRGI
ncbi:MAG: transglutaminase domain-containing protein [Lachnospiraceae bacterium]|nr:transglutaminase domain-containing protein [Lachnospiraceae bacterium]